MNKTKKLMIGVTSTALTFGLVGCSDSATPEPPVDDNCGDWEWDEDDGVWECDDSRSSYLGYYYFAGKYFKSKSLLYANSGYKDYSAKYKSSTGFGKGSSFGG